MTKSKKTSRSYQTELINERKRLQEELQTVDSALQELKDKELFKAEAVLLDVIDQLLLITHHKREDEDLNTCDDNHVSNSPPVCARCVLLHLKETNQLLVNIVFTTDYTRKSTDINIDADNITTVSTGVGSSLSKPSKGKLSAAQKKAQEVGILDDGQQTLYTEEDEKLSVVPKSKAVPVKKRNIKKVTKLQVDENAADLHKDWK